MTFQLFICSLPFTYCTKPDETVHLHFRVYRRSIYTCLSISRTYWPLLLLSIYFKVIMKKAGKSTAEDLFCNNELGLCRKKMLSLMRALLTHCTCVNYTIVLFQKETLRTVILFFIFCCICCNSRESCQIYQYKLYLFIRYLILLCIYCHICILIFRCNASSFLCDCNICSASPPHPQNENHL